MKTVSEFFQQVYPTLTQKGQDVFAGYLDLLAAKISLQSSLEVMDTQEKRLLVEIITSLTEDAQTKESLALLNALSLRLAELHAPDASSRQPHQGKKRRTLRLALIAALVPVAIIPYGLFAFAGDVRQAIRNTFTGGTATTYYMTTTGSLSLAGMHAPSYMPQGYSLTAKESSNKANISILTYEDPTGTQVKFYFYHTDGEAASIDNENGTISTVQVGSHPAMVSEGQDGVNMISGVYGEDSSYRIEGELPVDALIDMAASIAMQ